MKIQEKEYKLKQGVIKRIEDDWSHSYWNDELGYVPGVTTILDQGAPTPEFLKMWWKNTELSVIQSKLETAKAHGSTVHQLLEQLNMGLEIELSDQPKRVCEAVASYAQFIREWRPTELEPEQVLFYVGDRVYAGTTDLVFVVNGKRILIDFKTASSISKTHYLQVIAYKHAYEQSYGKKIDYTAVLQLGTKHKKLGKPDFLDLPTQGEGWQLHIAKGDIEDFYRIYDTWLFINDGEIPKPPKIKTFPDKFQLFEDGDVSKNSDSI